MKFLNHPFSILIFVGLLAVTGLRAQIQTEIGDDETQIPTVSLLGEDEGALSSLLTTYDGILLQVCSNDMEIAYARWMDMLGAMEDYSNDIGYDIRGVKAYLHVFWEPDGTLRHVSFFPKANSRNIPVDELKAFFKGFVKNYKMEIEAEGGFNHYASGSFPVFDRPALSAKKD